MPVARPGFVQGACLLVALAVAQLALVFLHPAAALAADPCPASMAPTHFSRGAEGILITSGGRFGGYGFYLKNGKPVWLWNMVDLERLKWEGAEPLSPGKHKVEFDFIYQGKGAGTLAFNNFSGVGGPGSGSLKVDGKVVATKTMAKTLPMILQWDESFDIGSDTLTGVN
ncbi:MAG: hypothetical protein WAM11_05555, partial [Cyanobium sp.]